MKNRLFSLAIVMQIAALLAGCGGSRKPPVVPSSLEATATTGQISLTWTAVTGATSYNLYYATTTGVTPSAGTKINVAATSYVHKSLTNGTTYYYVLTAVGRGGESTASAEVSATPVAVPSGLTATAAAGQVNLTWTAVPGATSYNLYYATAAGVTPSTGTKVSGLTGTSYSHTGLANGTTYHYVLTAVGKNSESVASVETVATPVATPPAAPAGLTAAPGNGQVALSWGAVTGAQTYNVFYGIAPGVTTSSASHVMNLTGTTYTVTGLSNGTLYFFVVTAANGAGQSAVSNEASATPTNGITVPLTPGTAASGTLQVSPTLSLTFHFDANAVSQNAIATITPIDQNGLPTPLVQARMANRMLLAAPTTNGTYLAGFKLTLNPQTITALNVPVTISGTLGDLVAKDATINLAMLLNNEWADEATFVIGAQGAINENIPSVSLPGLLMPGFHLLYKPAEGSNTSVSNLGVVLLADDGQGMSDDSYGLQVVHIYDAKGNLLTTPTVTLLDYSGAWDLDGSALTPDGSQGIMVDGGNTIRFFSAVQTGTPAASANMLDVSEWGSDGDAIAILPNGNEAVVSLDSDYTLMIISGILSGNPVVAETFSVPNYRDGLVMSDDGKVLLARGASGLTVFSVAPITPVPGSIGGTVANKYTQVVDLAELGSGWTEDGRDGMAISPKDSSRAVVVTPESSGGTVQLVTGLTSAPTVGTPITLDNAEPYSVSITPDGKLAIVGTEQGLLMFSGVDSGNLVQVGSLYAPTYSVRSGNATLSEVYTLGITLDGKYVAAGDASAQALVIVPFTPSGFATAPALAVPLAVGYNDQLLIH
jgi:fibronectin type 3 domain-containing protein